MISQVKLSEVLTKVSEDYNLNLETLLRNYSELNNTETKNINIENNTRCLALMAKGERCTRKLKCSKNGLCGIHLNMLEKNGSLPNGKFNNDKNKSAIGICSLNNPLDSNNITKSRKDTKKTKSSKSKIDSDVETDDSDDVDNKIKNSKLTQETKEGFNKVNNKDLSVEKSLSSNKVEQEVSCSSDNTGDILEKNKIMVIGKIDELVNELINETNYCDRKDFVKKIELDLKKGIESKFLIDNKTFKNLIKERLEEKYAYYDNKLKNDIEQLDRDDNESDEEIECIKIEKDNKVYLLDEETCIVYEINKPHSEVGKLENDIIVYF